MENPVENDELWDLLGRARPVKVSPFFSRRVLREIRQSPERPVLPSAMLRWLLSGCMAVLTVGFFVSLDLAGSGRHAGTTSEAFITAFDSASGIDSLVAAGDVSITDYSNGL